MRGVLGEGSRTKISAVHAAGPARRPPSARPRDTFPRAAPAPYLAASRVAPTRATGRGEAMDQQVAPGGIEMLAPSGLQSALSALVRLIEMQAPGMRASVLLLDDDGATLRHGAAPSLPDAYNAAIDGLRAGPARGSCGTAVHAGRQVGVTDLAADPLWAEFRDL